jgi:biopolymer transport protein ExbD
MCGYGKNKIQRLIIKRIVMAQLELQPAEASKTKRRVHAFVHIDMTPMVDLGFLLITFFIFTTSMSEKTAMSLMMPAMGPPSAVPQSKALSFLLADHNRVFAYEGDWKEAVQNNRVILTDYNGATGLRNMIIRKQKQLGKADALTVLVKPLDQSSYKNTIDALDEMTINGVSTYAIVEPTAEEKTYVMKMKQHKS